MRSGFTLVSAACRGPLRSLKGRIDPWPAMIGAPMSLPAAGIILLFLIIFGVLNRFEFGRFD